MLGQLTPEEMEQITQNRHKITDEELKSIIYSLGERKSVLTEAEILAIGANQVQIEKLVDSGVLYPSAFGIYMPENADFTEQHTRVEVAARFPEAVICLDSALNFNHVTTQIPHQVWIAVKEGSPMPLEPKLPIKVIYMPEPEFNQGVKTYNLEGITVKIYNIAKTVADCFIYEHEVGIDVAIEAMEQVIREQKCTVSEIMKYLENRSMRDYVTPYFNKCVEQALQVSA